MTAGARRRMLLTLLAMIGAGFLLDLLVRSADPPLAAAASKPAGATPSAHAVDAASSAQRLRTLLERAERVMEPRLAEESPRPRRELFLRPLKPPPQAAPVAAAAVCDVGVDGSAAAPHGGEGRAAAPRGVELVLSGVVKGESAFAVINGQTLTLGETIAGYELTAIDRTSVTLTRGAEVLVLRVAVLSGRP